LTFPAQLADKVCALLRGTVRINPTHRAPDWKRRWNRATRAAPIDFEEALGLAARTLDEVLRDRVDGLRWVAADGSWKFVTHHA